MVLFKIWFRSSDTEAPSPRCSAFCEAQSRTGASVPPQLTITGTVSVMLRCPLEHVYENQALKRGASPIVSVIASHSDIV